MVRSSPSDASWGPNGVGSQALGVFWGELGPTWGKVLHVFLQRHLLPRLILVLPWVWEGGWEWRAGSDGVWGWETTRPHWGCGAGPGWAENTGAAGAEVASWPEQCQGLVARLNDGPSTFEALCERDHWGAGPTTSSLQTGLGRAGPGAAPGRVRLAGLLSLPLIPRCPALPGPTMGTVIE